MEALQDSTWYGNELVFHGCGLLWDEPHKSVILEEIGFSKGNNEYDVLKRNTTGDLIIAAAGYVPGYFVTIFFIERLGRRCIQTQGFLIAGLVLGIIAGGYNHIGTGGNFSALLLLSSSSTSAPQRHHLHRPCRSLSSRVQGFAHGVSAATGKAGAIVSASLFNYLSGPSILGLANVLWIFFTFNTLGGIITYFFTSETTWKDADVTDYEWTEANVLGRGDALREREGRWSWLRGKAK